MHLIPYNVYLGVKSLNIWYFCSLTGKSLRRRSSKIIFPNVVLNFLWSDFFQNEKNSLPTHIISSFWFLFSFFILSWVKIFLEFQRVLRFCNGRKVLFNNMTNDEGVKAEQVNQVMAHVAAISKKNDEKPYTEDMYRNIKVNTFFSLIAFI